MATKKLIEVALPLEKINAESAREKSIRHGHPSTLHLWWARRPLAAARAVIWSSLVDDPSSHPEKFPTEEAQNAERQRLFQILENLVVWENSNKQDVLEAAKVEILKSTDGNPPALLDPFAGGGAIPLEAKRLGLKTHAHDLNPIPIMLNKSMLEIPCRFKGKSAVNPNSTQTLGRDCNMGAIGLSEDVEYYGLKIKQSVFSLLRTNYPLVDIPKVQGGGTAPAIAWLWARTVKCPNPACGCQMPLLKSKVIAKNIAYVQIEKNDKNQPVFTVEYGLPSDSSGTVSRSGATCAFCGSPVGFPYIRTEGKAGRIGAKLMAVVAKGSRGRIYVSPSEEQRLSAVINEKNDFSLGSIANYPGYLNPPAYGLDTFEALFTDRQLLFFTKLCEAIRDIGEEIEQDAIACGFPKDNLHLCDGGDGAKAYSEAIRVYLSFVLDKLVDYNSAVCSWNAVGQKMRNTFGMTGMSMSWDFAEANPFSGASGSYDNMLGWVVRSVSNLSTDGIAMVKQFDAQSDCGLRGIMVSTDPPYYSNVPYADFADFFYVWMRKNIGDIYPDLFRTMLTPKAEELVADPYRLGGKEKAAEYFEEGMLSACKQMYKYSRDDIPVTIYYAFKESDATYEDDKSKVSSTGWETMLTAIIAAGFVITGTWPMRTERASRTRGMNSNALASSIVLVCRKRSDNALQTTRRNLVNALRRELRPALKNLQESNIAPVDLAQSAIGPGMSVFSQYRRVLEADGSVMTVRSALQVINEEIDLYFNEQVGSMDSASRFCIDLYTQCAYNNIKYGEAEVLANAKGTSIPMMASHGVLYAKAGLLHLIERDEMPEKVDTNERNIWMLTQQLTRAMAKGGVNACAEIVFNMFGSNAESAKDLAYRLYTIAERKGWAEEAYAYNNLVVAWPDIQTRAAELKDVKPEQMKLFNLGLQSNE